MNADSRFFNLVPPPFHCLDGDRKLLIPISIVYGTNLVAVADLAEKNSSCAMKRFGRRSQRRFRYLTITSPNFNFLPLAIQFYDGQVNRGQPIPDPVISD